MKSKTIQEMEKEKKCPECKSTALHKDPYRAELVCHDCGLVLDEDLIDYGPEWRAFNNEQKDQRSRIGAPLTPLLHDKGLSTTISLSNRDSHGNSIPHKNRGQIYRLRKWQRRIRANTNLERNLVEALQILDRMSSNLSLPRNIRENAAILYRKAATERITRGRSMESIVAAALYLACRKHNLPRTLKEISVATNVSKKEIGRAYRHLMRKLDVSMCPATPEEYISRFSSKLDLSGETQLYAKELIQEVRDREILSGKGPNGIAAATIYMAAILCDERRTQKEVAKATGVTEVTIRNRYKEFADELGVDIPT